MNLRQWQDRYDAQEAPEYWEDDDEPDEGEDEGDDTCSVPS